MFRVILHYLIFNGLLTKPWITILMRISMLSVNCLKDDVKYLKSIYKDVLTRKIVVTQITFTTS